MNNNFSHLKFIRFFIDSQTPQCSPFFSPKIKQHSHHLEERHQNSVADESGHDTLAVNGQAEVYNHLHAASVAHGGDLVVVLICADGQDNVHTRKSKASAHALGSLTCCGAAVDMFSNRNKCCFCSGQTPRTLLRSDGRLPGCSHGLVPALRSSCSCKQSRSVVLRVPWHLWYLLIIPFLPVANDLTSSLFSQFGSLPLVSHVWAIAMETARRPEFG